MPDAELYARTLLPTPPPPLYGASATCPDPNSLQAAMNGCTAHGRWRPAEFSGGGIPEGTPHDYTLQFYQPHTGMVYTPPAFSDHIGVSHIMRHIVPANQTLQQDAATRATQPHRLQQKITAFFGISAVGAAAAALSIPAPAAPAAPATERVVVAPAVIKRAASETGNNAAKRRKLSAPGKPKKPELPPSQKSITSFFPDNH